MKVLSVVGNRPQFIKCGAAVDRAPRGRDRRDRRPHGPALRRELSQVFFEELGLAEPALPARSQHRRPEHDGVRHRERCSSESAPTGRSSTGTRTRPSPARAPPRAPEYRSPTWRPGFGAVTWRCPRSTTASRSTGISALLFCPDERSRGILAAEGVPGRVDVVGDVMADANLRFAPIARERIPSSRIEPAHATSSRRSIARRTSCSRGSAAWSQASTGSPSRVVFPAHPRTRAAHRGATDSRSARTWMLLEPLGYLELAALASQARVIVTDSGGLQKEAYWYGVPCVTVRPRPSGSTRSRSARTCSSTTIRPRSRRAVAQRAMPAERPPLYGDGHASERIAQVLRATIAATDEAGRGHRRRRLRRRAARAGLRRGRAAACCWWTSTPSGSRSSTAARATSRTSRRRRCGTFVEDGRSARHDRLRRAARRRRDPDRAPDAALEAARAGPLDRAGAATARSPSGCGRATSSCSSRRPIPARRARRCCPSSSAAAGSPPARTSSSRSRRSASTRAAPTGRRRTSRRSSAASTRRRPRRPPPSTACAVDTVAPRLVARGGRADEAAREHLPLGQHRARQRAGPALRPDGDRRLGGRRGGCDEAVRVHGFKPGPGLGGHCIPIDPFYLTWKAREYGFYTRVHRAGRQGQRDHAVLLPLARLAGAEPRRGSARSSGSRILVLGVAYKPDISDMRESPAREADRAAPRTPARTSRTTTRTSPSSTERRRAALGPARARQPTTAS